MNCIDCKYLNGKSEYFYSYVTKRGYKIRQNVNCKSKNVIYLVTCKTFKKKSPMANYIP